MKKIAIYGAGGFGRETALMIKQINAVQLQWDFVGYYDDYTEGLGGLEELNAVSEKLYLVVAIADPKVRENVVGNIANANIKFATLIHPSAIIDTGHVTMGEGAIIAANNVFTTNIVIGDHSIVNLSCTIGHDVRLGNFSSVMPGVHLSGNVHIGTGVLVGTGARILQNIVVGDRSKIGAGAVVIDHVAENITVVGIPAKQKEN